MSLGRRPRQWLRRQEARAFDRQPRSPRAPCRRLFGALSRLPQTLARSMWNTWATLLQMSRRPPAALPAGASRPARPARPGTPARQVLAPPGTPPAPRGDLARLFECPVCLDYALPPPLQCQSGHLVCSHCRPKLTRCPTCRGPLGSLRSLVREKAAHSALPPCKHAVSGCGRALPRPQKAAPEEPCESRPCACPCPGAACRWQGPPDAVLPHLAQLHSSITALQGEDIVFLATDISLPGAVDWVMLQSCFGAQFLLVLKKQQRCDGHQQFYAIVQLLGTREQAQRFAYRLELRGHRRRMTWEDTPRSVHEGIAAAVLSSDCLIFDTGVAQLFAENGDLGIHVTISMR